MGIHADDIVFLYAGKIDANKNVKLLLDTFCNLEGRNAHLIIAGSGIMEKELIAVFAHKKNIHFLPFQNQSVMPLIYGMADLFVLPSLSETWGLSINEAMACEKAVLVSSACGAAIDLVKDGKNGYVFESNSGNDLQNKLELLAKDRLVLKKMGVSSGEIISSWTFEKTCGQIEMLMNKLINQNKRTH